MRSWRNFKFRIIFWLFFFALTIFCIYTFFFTKHPPKHPIINDEQKRVDSPPEWIHPVCNCSKGFVSPHADPAAISTCPKSWFRGPNQKVISYSFYGNTDSGYFKSVSKNSKRVEELYPGWTVRLYHDIKPHNRKGMTDLCREVCTYPHLDECYVGDITDQFQGIKNKFGMVWRFLLMGDPSVDVFGVRDLDSPVYQREVDAVNDWLKTDKTFHIMRDNPMHFTCMFGGMWGARNTNNITLLQIVRDELISEARSKMKSYDQALLAQFVCPVALNDGVQHDSFICANYPGSRPWPSQRVNGTFVGDTEGISITQICPEKCRPPEHQDWIYC